VKLVIPRVAGQQERPRLLAVTAQHRGLRAEEWTHVARDAAGEVDGEDVPVLVAVGVLCVEDGPSVLAPAVAPHPALLVARQLLGGAELCGSRQDPDLHDVLFIGRKEREVLPSGEMLGDERSGLPKRILRGIRGTFGSVTGPPL
jgi:hypothetical protein